MEDIYNWYRQGLLFYGPYRTYFSKSSKSFSEYVPKQYSPERQSRVSEGERKEQHHETNTAKNTEIKSETNKAELSQKVEDSAKIESTKKIEHENKPSENQTELSYEKSGLPHSCEIGQTDIRRRNRPSPYYDRAETRW